MFLNLDFNSQVPIYQQIRDQVIWGMATGLLKPGDQLPSVRQLASDIGINLHTVNKAYQLLKQDGYLIVDRRIGAKIEDKIPPADETFLNKQADVLNILLAEYYLKGVSEVDLKKLVTQTLNKMKGQDQ